MNILFLITRRQTRGAETFAVQLPEELHRAGHRLVIGSLYSPASIPLEIPGHLKAIDLSRLSPRPMPHFSIARRISQVIRDESIDLVQANASDNLKYALLSRKLFGWKAPLVYRNASIMSAWVHSNWHHRLTTWLLSQADAIASVSDKSKIDIVESFGQPPAKVHRLGIAAYIPKSIDPLRSRIKVNAVIGEVLSNEDRLIFHIGAFTPEKNHQGLLRIFAAIEEEYGQNVRLISIGSGPLMEVVKAGAFSSRIHFLGYRNDVQDLLPAADLLLLPSLIEGTPGVLLEAGANQVAALAYRVGAVDECYPSELVDHLTITLGEELEMAEKSVNLLKDIERRREMGIAFQSFVQNNYAMASIGKQFEMLYKQLLAKATTRD